MRAHLSIALSLCLALLFIHPSFSLPFFLLFVQPFLLSPVVTKTLYKALKIYRDKSDLCLQSAYVAEKGCTNKEKFKKMPQVFCWLGV